VRVEAVLNHLNALGSEKPKPMAMMRKYGVASHPALAPRSMNRPLSRIELWEDLAREANFQPDAMAALCSISLRQLERFFVERFNKTPGAWAQELRCRLARELIEAGWMNKAVAAELHFSNDSHLCHEFRRRYGVSPRAFAPTYRKSKNVALLQ